MIILGTKQENYALLMTLGTEVVDYGHELYRMGMPKCTINGNKVLFMTVPKEGIDAQFDHLRELLEAEADGSIAPIPCKIGDRVWAIRSYNGSKHPQEGIVSEIYFLPDMTLQIVVKHVARGIFGKTIFHTLHETQEAIDRLEAEKA